MDLFPEDLRARLLANGARPGHDHVPVVKLFTPDAGATWLLTELDPDEPDIAFGLCDLGIGFPELGTVSVEELQSLRGTIGLPVERDLYFQPRFPLSIYAEAAGRSGAIVEAERRLAQIAGEQGKPPHAAPASDSREA